MPGMNVLMLINSDGEVYISQNNFVFKRIVLSIQCGYILMSL